MKTNKENSDSAKVDKLTTEEYELEFDAQELAVFFVLNGERSDNYFCFEEMETTDGREHYLIVNMFSPESKKGWGTKALQCFIDNTNGVLHVRDRWMTDCSDGSNVLPEAWEFVEKMMKKGYIQKHDISDEDHWSDE